MPLRLNKLVRSSHQPRVPHSQQSVREDLARSVRSRLPRSVGPLRADRFKMAGQEKSRPTFYTEENSDEESCLPTDTLISHIDYVNPIPLDNLPQIPETYDVVFDMMEIEANCDLCWSSENQMSPYVSTGAIRRQPIRVVLGGSDYIPNVNTEGRTNTSASFTSFKDETSKSQDGKKYSDLASKIEWANAPEFVPKANKYKSYAEVVHSKPDQQECASSVASEPVSTNTTTPPTTILCPYLKKPDGFCHRGKDCPYIHGEVCEMCHYPVLHPGNMEQQRLHKKKCVAEHEKQMELSFAVARSKEKTCGICFEVIMDKQISERRFGILPQCNHCFCLACIRRWRQARQFENRVVRSCPECRVTSDFVCPSLYWVDTKEDKEKLIMTYKNALSQKQCKYFRQGRGRCPFGNKCFYLHAYPDGTKADVGPPRRSRPLRQRHDHTELASTLQQIFIMDFLDEPEHLPYYSLSTDDIEDLISFFTETDESEWSDMSDHDRDHDHDHYE